MVRLNSLRCGIPASKSTRMNFLPLLRRATSSKQTWPGGLLILFLLGCGREDIRVYTDETKSDERVIIKARSIIDFGAAYDVIDSKQQQKVGALKRKGWSSRKRE